MLYEVFFLRFCFYAVLCEIYFRSLSLKCIKFRMCKCFKVLLFFKRAAKKPPQQNSFLWCKRPCSLSIDPPAMILCARRSFFWSVWRHLRKHVSRWCIQSGIDGKTKSRLLNPFSGFGYSWALVTHEIFTHIISIKIKDIVIIWQFLVNGFNSQPG
jgi:hypothetical protein